MPAAGQWAKAAGGASRRGRPGIGAEDGLFAALSADPDRLRAAGIASVTRIGDCLAPATVAHAVHAGHKFAREFESEATPGFARERLPAADGG